MSLDDICNVSITASTAAPTRPGYGTPLIAAYHTVYTGRVRTYGSLKEMTDAGFPASHPAVLAATSVFSQNPRVRRIKVGRRALPPVQTVRLKCLSAVQGDTYSLQVNATAVNYTVPASATVASVATAIAALIDADPKAAATANTDTITVTCPTTGGLNDFAGWTRNLSISDDTADPGITTDLGAILAEDSDWYGLVLDSQGKAETLAAAAWTEANGKLFAANNSDTVIKDPVSTTDVAAALRTAAYARTGLLFSGSKLLSYSGAAWLGNRFPYDPGADTWSFKTLRGVPADALTDGEVTAILGKKANVYTPIAGLNVTQYGTSAAGEYFDVTRFVDWLKSEIQVRIFSLLVNNQKIPYTDAGVDVLRNTLLGTLRDGITRGGLAADPEPTVSAPLVADVNTVDRAGRHLPDVTFSAQLAGAIHQLTINGTLSV